ncbi:hypothetical protein F5Y16DRAFT_368034 [Xylariaceae sp. FL0255]|nr:hypothetical protein F5Y16DRAFT_368034 [Xylariaceae sp. FL0255]
MTYPGHFPHGQQPGFTNQQQQQTPNSWSNPQQQNQEFQLQPQYQHAVYPTTNHAYPHQHIQNHNGYLQQQPQQQVQAQQQFQFHAYDPSFDQRPAPQNHMMQRPMQHVQHAQNHYIQPSPQQQNLDWQPMPPPMPVPSPSSSYHAHQPQHLPQLQPHQQQQQQHNFQHQQQHQQRVNTPNVAHSPQIQQQHQPQQPQQHANSPRIPPHAMVNNVHRNSVGGARPDHTNRVSASPHLASQVLTRSPSVSSTRSPAPTPALIPHHHDTNSLLICVAEDLFSKAQEGQNEISASVDEQRLYEYQKMVATGLGCLEVVLKSNKLAPRLEALVRLRYASILCAETNNVMEAETALTKGITLCDRNRFADLKYSMHFLLVKLLFSQHKDKAALIAVDARIRDAEALKHIPWVYAFRFLKASFYLQSYNPTEAHALENLKAIATIASQRGESAVFTVASLLEAMSHLRSMRDEAIVRIQACIAQASKYQLDESTRIMQLDVLALVLDLACSLQQKAPQMISQKMKALQARLDESLSNKDWGFQDRRLIIPIYKQNPSQRIISDDTKSILQLGSDGDACDYVIMSFWTKLEAFALTYIYSGLAMTYQQPYSDKGPLRHWDEALKYLQNNRTKMKGASHCLEDAIDNVNWEKETQCYLRILKGLRFATSTNWVEVKKCIKSIDAMIDTDFGDTVLLYSKYLKGVYYQGTGDLEAAIAAYSDPSLSLDNDRRHKAPAESDVALLTSLNLIWIMQHPNHRDNQATQDLLEQLHPLCADHPNLEIRTAYNLVLAAVQTNPPIPMTSVKLHISMALNNAKILGDVQTLSIALNLMRAKLFQSIVGEQALKSAKAASTQAHRSGNKLWMSVADGMLSQSYEVQGQLSEAKAVWYTAIQDSNQAFSTTGELRELPNFGL